MKAVMLSIQPKWIELISSGKKTVEVRKTKPKIDVPFKCYIYCTKGDWLTSVNGKVQKPNNMVIDLSADRKIEELNGKVIGEFVCDKIVEFENSWYEPAFGETSELSCVGLEELALYLGGKEVGYGWHITDLVIYEHPKELSEFKIECEGIGKDKSCFGCEYYQVVEDLCSPFVGSGRYNIKCVCDYLRPIKRPFQSWGYVEEILPPLVEPKGKTITIPKWTYDEHKGETE